MPLHDGAAESLRDQLNKIANGDRVSIIEIGFLTFQQIQHICEVRRQIGLADIDQACRILYLGRHHFDSRSKQGYTIEDMIAQIQAATSADCEVLISSKMTVLRSPLPRPDGYGNLVRDQAVFELTQRKPHAELFSVIPKGDKISPLHKRQSP